MTLTLILYSDLDLIRINVKIFKHENKPRGRKCCISLLTDANVMDAQTWTGKLYISCCFFCTLYRRSPGRVCTRRRSSTPSRAPWPPWGDNTVSSSPVPTSHEISVLPSGNQNSTCFIATTCVSGSLLYYVNSTAIISIDCIDRAVSFIHQTLTISWISEFARILTKVEDNLSNKG